MTTRKVYKWIPAIAVVALLQGCDQFPSQASAKPAIDQKNLCQVSGWRHDTVAKECKEGQKVVFLPSTFGNEQLPILFAAVNCDHRYTVTTTNGGVSCIYLPITPEKEAKKSNSK